MKKAFSLLELIIVIAIIGILAASIAVTFGGASESGRAAKCRSNLRQLAQACYNVAMADEDNLFPMAGSCEALGKFSNKCTERRGWISWLSQGKYPGGVSVNHQNCPMAGVFCPESDIKYAYTNGAIWKVISGNSACFICPTMVKDAKAKRNGREMAWCYVMSARFHYDHSRGRDSTESPASGVRPSDLSRPDRTLMFAEMCLDDINGGGQNDYFADCVLEYGEDEMKKERIGFPHKVRGGFVGHVAFADQHVESYTQPKGGKSSEQDLTKWLCQGYDVTLDKSVYEKDDESVGGTDDDDDD